MAVILILWPVLANVYAWKHDKTIGITATSLTAVTIISGILFWFLSKNVKEGSIREKIAAIFVIITFLAVIPLMVLANVYAWKTSKVDGSLVSSLTVADILMYFIQSNL